MMGASERQNSQNSQKFSSDANLKKKMWRAKEKNRGKLDSFFNH
jgi:hypothetical protein